MAEPFARKVLLVEDDDTIRPMMARRLTLRGFEVTAVSTGEEAVAAARAERPGVVVMDLRLPGMSGWEAASAIRADSATSIVPLVALTAHVSADDREQARTLGCESFFLKPVDFQALVQRLEELMHPQEKS